jgi:hypothetical protein
MEKKSPSVVISEVENKVVWWLGMTTQRRERRAGTVESISASCEWELTTAGCCELHV